MFLLRYVLLQKVILWIIGSDAFYRTTSYRNCFFTYNMVDRREVLMENDIFCRIVSIGSVKIKIHDDVVRSIINVRHVLDLRSSISIGL